MKKPTLKAVKIGLFFAFFSELALAAPKIPEDLLNRSLVYCTSVSGFTFNPQKADVGTNMNVVTEQIYDKLLEFDVAENRLKPALAERFEVSDDGLEIRLFLRKNVEFQTTAWFKPSRPMNAEDVLFSLNRMLGKVDDLPSLDRAESRGSSFLQKQSEVFHQRANLAHYPYFESVALNHKIAAIDAVSPSQIRLTLTEPDNAILAHLASQYAVILSKEYALQLNADENLSQLDRLPVGTGSYQVQNYRQNDFVRLTPHPHYWGKKAQIPNLVVDFSSDGSGRMAKYLNGECDVVAFPEPSQLQAFAELPNTQIVQAEGANLAFLAFNMQKPAMQAVIIRQKIAEAVRPERLVSQLFFEAATVADNALPPVLLKTDKPAARVKRDPEPLIEPIRLKMWVVDEKRVFNLHPAKMAEMIKRDLAEIGISLEIKPVSRAFIAQANLEGELDYDLILTGWLGNNLDPNAFLQPILSCKNQHQVTNLANWCNEEFDYWLERAKSQQSFDESRKFYALAQKQLDQELPILPLVNAKRLLIANQRVSQLAISPFGEVRLSALTLKSEK